MCSNLDSVCVCVCVCVCVYVSVAPIDFLYLQKSGKLWYKQNEEKCNIVHLHIQYNHYYSVQN